MENKAPGGIAEGFKGSNDVGPLPATCDKLDEFVEEATDLTLQGDSSQELDTLLRRDNVRRGVALRTYMRKVVGESATMGFQYPSSTLSFSGRRFKHLDIDGAIEALRRKVSQSPQNLPIRNRNELDDLLDGLHESR